MGRSPISLTFHAGYGGRGVYVLRFSFAVNDRPPAPQHGQLMASLPAGIRSIILRSPREVRQFENNLPHSLDTGAA